MQQAVRQGDVLIRPIRQKIEVVDSKIDWTMLRQNITSHITRLKDVTEVDQAAAETAVIGLYKVLGRAAPHITWFDGERIEPDTIRGTPIRLTLEMITAVTRLHLLDFDPQDAGRVLRQLGYDGTTASGFRLANNKRMLSRSFHVRRRSETRPPWTVDLGNMICQFDRSVLVLYELVNSLGLLDLNHTTDRKVAAHADAVARLLDSTFGALLFEESCILMHRPLSISLSPSHQLSATLIDPATMKTRTKRECPAYEPRFGQMIFAVNGVEIPQQTIQFILSHPHMHSAISLTTPMRVRSAAINYVGWETFYDKVPPREKHQLDKSSYGELWQIHAGNQEIYVVRVLNSSAEPDGSYRHYVLPVDPWCRPIPNPADPRAVHGIAQDRTALNAVASTFGLTGADYASQLGAQS